MATTMTEIPIKDLALTTAPAGKQLLVRDASAGLQRIDYDQIAKNLVESYGSSSLAGKNQSIKAAIDSLNSGLTQYQQIVYPIGAIYLSWVSTSPETLFGGKQERLKGGYLYGCQDGSEVNTGSGTLTFGHTLTYNEMPRHSHGQVAVAHGYPDWPVMKTNNYGVAIDYGSSNYLGPNRSIHASPVDMYTSTGDAGKNQAHSHKLSYIAVFMQRRIE